MALVIDTDVVSFLYKRDTRADLYRPHLDVRMLTISFMTLAELECWAISANWGVRRRQHLERYLQRFVFYQSDRPLCRRWAEVSEDCRRIGRPIAPADALIAATALLLGVPLVTHNGTDSTGVPGLVIVSETGS